MLKSYPRVVIMKNEGRLKILWALDEMGCLTHISSAFKNSHYKCVDRNCGKDILVAEGDTNKKHFKHKNNSNCSSESFSHKLAKKILLELINGNKNIFLEYRCSICYSKVDLEITKKIKDSVEEQRYPETQYVADVVGYDGNKNPKIFFEIVMTNPINLEKEDGIKDFHWVELKADEVIGIYETNKKDQLNYRFPLLRYGNCKNDVVCIACKNKNEERILLLNQLVDRWINREINNEAFSKVDVCSCISCKREFEREPVILKLKAQEASEWRVDRKNKCYVTELKGKKKTAIYNLVALYGGYKADLGEKINLIEGRTTIFFRLNDIRDSLEKKNGVIIKKLNSFRREDGMCNSCLELKSKIEQETSLDIIFHILNEQYKKTMNMDGVIKTHLSRRTEKEMVDDLIYLIKTKYESHFKGLIFINYLKVIKKYSIPFFENDIHKALEILEYLEFLNKSQRYMVWQMLGFEIQQQKRINKALHEEICRKFWE